VTASGQGHRYDNPPIEEGLCQVAFTQPLAWSVATPGRLHEALKDAYPAEPEAQDQVAASLQLPPNDVGPTFAFNRGPQRFIYKDQSGTRLLVASSQTLSVSSLRPYEGWNKLRIRFREALETLTKVTGVQSVTQVSLRYINRILVSDPRLDTDRYFHLRVQTAENGRASFAGFLHRVESILTDGVTRVTSTFATIDAPPEQNAFLLDLDFRRPDLSLTDPDSILEIADDLKAKENAEFESSITDETRKLFQ
jgi:uncharacterized protein (TIGR04255 family)